jgi:hypothetical protein
MRRVPAEWRKAQALVFGANGLAAKKPGESLSHTERLETIENRSTTEKRFERTPPMAGRPLPPPDQRSTPRLEASQTSTLPLAGR